MQQRTLKVKFNYLKSVFRYGTTEEEYEVTPSTLSWDIEQVKSEDAPVVLIAHLPERDLVQHRTIEYRRHLNRLYVNCAINDQLEVKPALKKKTAPLIYQPLENNQSLSEHDVFDVMKGSRSETINGKLQYYNPHLDFWITGAESLEKTAAELRGQLYAFIEIDGMPYRLANVPYWEIRQKKYLTKSFDDDGINDIDVMLNLQLKSEPLNSHISVPGAQEFFSLAEYAECFKRANAIMDENVVGIKDVYTDARSLKIEFELLDDNALVYVHDQTNVRAMMNRQAIQQTLQQMQSESTEINAWSGW